MTNYDFLIDYYYKHYMSDNSRQNFDLAATAYRAAPTAQDAVAIRAFFMLLGRLDVL